MKILSAAQIRAADAYTIAHEPIASIDLMERAAKACTRWIVQHFASDVPICIFCGMGNNGGDGLAIARQLHEQGYHVNAYIVFHGSRFSPDCELNKKRLEHLFGSPLQAIHDKQDFPTEIPENALFIDALFGTGLTRPLEGLSAAIVDIINAHRQQHKVISIDLPSGLFADQCSQQTTHIYAHYTLSFECLKLAFLLPENAEAVGDVQVISIGLHPAFLEQVDTPFFLTDETEIRSMLKSRQPFSHKGHYGHALLIAGSYGKMGAALLAASACMRSGAGLLTCQIPQCGYSILQSILPEAMCLCDANEFVITEIPATDSYNAIGIGPGLGHDPMTFEALTQLLNHYSHPLVLDADALNLLAVHPRWLSRIPKKSILTPHPKEFERLFGPTENHFERLTLQLSKARELHCYLLLKGKYSAIATPEGRCFFNPTGNPGMATGGSGDVLTGILTGLLAQRYPPQEAALLGAYLHGRAGDLAAATFSPEAMIASDIIHHLGAAFQSIQQQ